MDLTVENICVMILFYILSTLIELVCAGRCVIEVEKETTEKPHEDAPDKDLKQLQGSFCELHNCLLLL